MSYPFKFSQPLHMDFTIFNAPQPLSSFQMLLMFIYDMPSNACHFTSKESFISSLKLSITFTLLIGQLGAPLKNIKGMFGRLQ